VLKHLQQVSYLALSSVRVIRARQIWDNVKVMLTLLTFPKFNGVT
jgi:hypothetical protein